MTRPVGEGGMLLLLLRVLLLLLLLLLHLVLLSIPTKDVTVGDCGITEASSRLGTEGR